MSHAAILPRALGLLACMAAGACATGTRADAETLRHSTLSISPSRVPARVWGRRDLWLINRLDSSLTALRAK